MVHRNRLYFFAWNTDTPEDAGWSYLPMDVSNLCGSGMPAAGLSAGKRKIGSHTWCMLCDWDFCGRIYKWKYFKEVSYVPMGL